MVDVLLSETGFVAGLGTIFSATLEMGSRACTSFTEAKPRVKTAGRTAAAESQQGAIGVAWCWRRVRTCPPEGQTSKRACASHCQSCGVESVGCLGGQSVAIIEGITEEQA